MNTSHNHIISAIMFAVVSYVGSYVVWTHLFAGLGTVAGLTFMSMLGLFLIGYVVTFFYQHVNHTGTTFPVMLWLLLLGTTVIPGLTTGTIGDTVLIGHLVDTLVTAFLGTYVIGRVLNGTLLSVTK